MIGVPGLELPESCTSCPFVKIEYISEQHGKAERKWYGCGLKYPDFLTELSEYKKKRHKKCELINLKDEDLSV